MAVHEQPVNVQDVAVVEVEIAAHAIKRLARGQYLRIADEVRAAETLHRTSVEVVASQSQVGVVARPRGSGSLDGMTALGIALQVETVSEAAVEIFEVGVRGKSNPAVGPAGRRRHKRAGVGRLRYPAGRSEEHTSELQSHLNLVCRLLLEKKKKESYFSRSKKLRTYN